LLIYNRFNWAHRKLHNRLLQLGAQSIFERGESDEQHPEGIDGTFLPWSLALRERLLDVFPLPDGQSAIPDHVFLEPKWILEELPDSHELNGTTCEKSPPRAGGTDALSDEVPPDGLFNIRDGIVATVYSNTRLTPLEHWQDVRHLTLDLHEKKSYTPGDILAICPKNFPSDVNHFLELMGWTAIADSRIDFVPNPQRTRTIASGRGSQQPITFPNRTLTLRELLTNHLDIISIPRRSFFAQLLHYSNDPFQRERLQEFTNPELIDELYDYTTRPRRSILEVLDEFTSVKIPWQKVCSVIPIMRPRQFSIASGGSLKVAEPGIAASARVELLVAIVKYRTVIKRIRQGVATRYIASLRPGQQITVSMVKGGLGFKQQDIKRPVVMVGPGTGVAPMRSLIYERLSIRKELQSLPPSAVEGDLLFYGCRNRKADFFFEDEWKRLAAETGLTVLPAFSRDQVR
jgi:sulfite reductase alpha subunit-like flavoprotein